MSIYYHVSPNIIESERLLPMYGHKILDPRYFSNCMKNHNQYLIEMIFEEVRLKNFREAPSRLKCIYLLRSIQEALFYKEKSDYLRSGVIYKVSISNVSKKLACDMSFLDCHLATYEEIVNNATKYWKGEILNQNRVEFLCEGEVNIVGLIR